MSFKPICPVAPNGILHLNTGGYGLGFDSVSTVVDAELLVSNWRRIFSHVNGQLMATDFDRDAFSTTFPPFYDGQHVTIGRTLNGQVVLEGDFHNHDGITSSFLGANAVTFDLLDGRSMGALWGGSKHLRTIVLSGTAYFPKVEIPTKVTSYTIASLAVPFDAALWGKTSGYLFHKDAGTYYLQRTVRVVATIRSPNAEYSSPTVSSKLKIQTTVTVNGSSSVTAVGIILYNAGSSALQDVYVDWMLLGLN